MSHACSTPCAVGARQLGDDEFHATCWVVARPLMIGNGAEPSPVKDTLDRTVVGVPCCICCLPLPGTSLGEINVLRHTFSAQEFRSTKHQHDSGSHFKLRNTTHTWPLTFSWNPSHDPRSRHSVALGLDYFI